MKDDEFPPILPETDGWDDAAKEHPRIQRLHRLFIATGVFFFVVLAAIAVLYFTPVSIKTTNPDGTKYEYHVKRFVYWFKKNSTGQKLEIRHGKERRWNANEKLIWQRDWSNDTWDGWEKEWYPTGQLRNEQEWKDGMKDGIDNYWHANGNLWRETHWNNDIQVGDAKVWDESGKVIEEPKTTKVLDLGDGVKMEMMLIPSGVFLMGSNDYENEKPIHKVNITQFYMTNFEVTQEQFEKIMGTNPSDFKGSRNPVNRVSWDEAVLFCQKVSRIIGDDIRLPTEAEWEYACRAGSNTKFYWGDDDKFINDYAWYWENSNLQIHAVGLKIPNKWGLYDMNGNVWEWCSDIYNDYPSGRDTDPAPPPFDDIHILRGGSCGFDSSYSNSSHRAMSTSEGQQFSIGFRVVCSVSNQSK